MYVYDADIYCDACGEKIAADLTAQGIADTPATTRSRRSPADSPNHCPSGAECLGDAVDLRPYGARDDALVGAETCIIGELVQDDLTDDGVDYLREMLAETPRTPYQAALHSHWREAFADYDLDTTTQD